VDTLISGLMEMKIKLHVENSMVRSPLPVRQAVLKTYDPVEMSTAICG